MGEGGTAPNCSHVLVTAELSIPLPACSPATVAGSQTSLAALVPELWALVPSGSRVRSVLDDGQLLKCLAARACRFGGSSARLADASLPRVALSPTEVDPTTCVDNEHTARRVLSTCVNDHRVQLRSRRVATVHPYLPRRRPHPDGRLDALWYSGADDEPNDCDN
jgi:hypothetical protein